MISIYMIITALVPTTLAKGSVGCDLSGPTGDPKCFGALGEPLIFHLPTNVSQLILKKDVVSIILNIVNMAVNLNEKYNKSATFSNGRLKLDNARRTDSGDYQLEIYRSDGLLLNTNNIHLEIQAPVSKPLVSQMCLSPEQKNISCSSEGDEVEFIFTLDGLVLVPTRGHSESADTSLAGSTDKQLKPSVSNVTISLQVQLTGNLMCSVQNKVSREETVIHLTSCQGCISHFSLVTVAVIASVSTLLLLLAPFLVVKYLNEKKGPMTVNEGIAEDEIVYSDVSVIKHTRKTTPNSH